MQRKAPTVLFAAALSACATTSGARYEDDLSIQDVETDPRWLGHLYTEADALRPFPVNLAGRAGTVLATDTPTMKGGMLMVPVGETAPIVCASAPPGRAGAALNTLISAAMAGSARQEIKYLALGQVGSRPAVVVHTLSSDGPADGNHIEITLGKAVVVPDADGAVACMHHAFGYRETLERVADSLATTLASPTPAVTTPVKFEGGGVGVRVTTVGEAGKVTVQTVSARRRSRSELVTEDLTQVFTPAGAELTLTACEEGSGPAEPTRYGAPPFPDACTDPAGAEAARAALTAPKAGP